MKASLRNIKTVLVPIGAGTDGQTALAIAQTIAGEVILVGVVPIPQHESISAGAQLARQVRKRLLSLSGPSVRFKSTVIVSETPWKDLQMVISQEQPDLFMVEWENGRVSCGIPLPDVLSHSLCNIAIVRGTPPIKLDRALIAVRGGPYAELAFQMGLGLHAQQLDVLHLALTGAMNDAPFKGLKHILRHIPEANLRSITTEDVARTIFEESHHYDIVILGVTASKSMGGSSTGPVADRLLRESPSTVMVVKTCRPNSESMLDESAGAQVDLLERIHHNQELEALGKMSFAIIQTVLRKLETRYERSIIEDVNKTMKLIRRGNGGYFLDVELVAELERPPMNTIPAYLERHKV